MNSTSLKTAIPRVLLSIFCVLLTISAHAADDEDAYLAVADYLDFEQVSDAQISPDGSQIIYTRRWVDQQEDRMSSALWIMDSDGSRHRFMRQGSNARWSPSGDRILFIAKGDNEKPQIFVRWMDDEGATSQVTRVTVTPSSPEWSPDGQQIAFVAIVPAEDKWKIDLPSAPEGATWSKPPRILDRIHYRQDRVGFTEPGFSHLFVVPAGSGTARQVTDGEWNVGAQFDGQFRGTTLSWTPDSQSILFDGWMDSNGDDIYRRSHIYSINVESEEIEQLTAETGFWTSPAISAGGGQIAYAGYPAGR
jgi:dipeptidyl aminopeptidase/acylaminoacyl peptidase